MKIHWTLENLKAFIYDDEMKALENEKLEEKLEEEYDCPIHGKLGGIDECPRC